MKSVIYIILVNWNGWKDTIECLEGLLSLSTIHKFRILICDNGSSDKSLQHIKEWAQNRTDNPATFDNESLFKTIDLSQSYKAIIPFPSKITCISCDSNLGFAGGCNVGIRYAMKDPEINYIWLLNNDTVVDSNALDHLVKKSKQDERYGMIGSTIIYYDKRNTVQAFGGARFFPCIGTSMHIGSIMSKFRPVDESRIERIMDYVFGASIFFKKEFIEKIGPMSEDYFLYYEEIDWATRSRNIYKLGYASKSIVYHKSGKSIGSSNKTSKRSLLSEYYLSKNKLLITRKFFPKCIITVKLFLMIQALLRALSGQLHKSKIIFSIAFSNEKNPA